MKRLISFFVIFTFIAFVGFNNGYAVTSQAEEKQVDSLINSINAQLSHDTTVAKSILALTEILYISKPDTMIPLCERAIRIAEKNLIKPDLKGNEEDCFQKILGNALNNIGYIFKQRGDFTEAIDYYSRSLKINEKVGNMSGSAYALSNLGVIFFTQGNMVEALEYFESSLKLRRQLGEKLGIAMSLNNLAGIYENYGDVSKAIELYFEGLKLWEELDHKDGLATTLNNLAGIYKNQGDISKAMEYYSRALKIHQAAGNKRGIAYVINNQGVIHLDNGDFSNALKCFSDCLEIWEILGEKNAIAGCYNNFGIIHHNKGEYAKAIEYYSKSLEINEQISNKNEMTYSLNYIAKIYFDQGKIAMAERLALRSLAIGKAIGFPFGIMNSAEILKQIYKKTGCFEDGLKMNELFVLMRDSINNDQTRKSSIKQQFKYEYEKRAAADSIIVVEERKVAVAQFKQEQTARYLLYGGLAMLIFFSGFIFNRLRITRRQKSIIETQKFIVDEKNKEIKEAKAHIEEKHKEVTDSIHYAKRIQTALLTNENYIKKNLDRLHG